MLPGCSMPSVHPGHALPTHPSMRSPSMPPAAALPRVAGARGVRLRCALGGHSLCGQLRGGQRHHGRPAAHVCCRGGRQHAGAAGRGPQVGCMCSSVCVWKGGVHGVGVEQLELQLHRPAPFNAHPGLLQVMPKVAVSSHSVPSAHPRGKWCRADGEAIEVLALPVARLQELIEDDSLAKSAALPFAFVWVQRQLEHNGGRLFGS